jgi:hypothetical protein
MRESLAMQSTGTHPTQQPILTLHPPSGRGKDPTPLASAVTFCVASSLSLRLLGFQLDVGTNPCHAT